MTGRFAKIEPVSILQVFLFSSEIVNVFSSSVWGTKLRDVAERWRYWSTESLAF